ncbi:hypothetical protein N9Y42_08150 [Mariniblastus sp.]|nr:hypothetical protein [Mariniblastus sp.]
MNQLRLLVLFLVALSAGCSGVSATLFVDNDSDEFYRFQVDGGKEKSIGARDHAKCHLTYGEHRVTVTAGEDRRVVYDEIKTFEPYPEGSMWRHFLLDPDADTKYAIHEFSYYQTPEEAKNGKSDRRIKGLRKQHWIDVPKGVCVLDPMPGVFVSEHDKETQRRCVVRDAKPKLSAW